MNNNAKIETERHDIDGKGRTLGELFFNRRYAIDTYQREYKWQTKQVVELIDDLSGKFWNATTPAMTAMQSQNMATTFSARSSSARKKPRATSLTASNASPR